MLYIRGGRFLGKTAAGFLILDKLQVFFKGTGLRFEKEIDAEENFMEEQKIICLKADQPFYNNVDLAICDYGGPKGALRIRGKITVDYAKSDIEQLKAQGIDTLEEALDYYKNKIYNTVRRYLLVDFQLEEGWEPVLTLIKEKIEQYY